jgi:hypothetical protein
MRLKKIKLNALPRLLLSERQRLPHISGIYFSVYEGRVLYVGKAKSLMKRWAGRHHRLDEFKGYDVEIRWLACSESDLVAGERSAIALLNPPLNQNQLTGNTAYRFADLLDAEGRLSIPEIKATRAISYSIKVPADIITALAAQATQKGKPVGLYIKECAVYGLEVQAALTDKLEFADNSKINNRRL